MDTVTREMDTPIIKPAKTNTNQNLTPRRRSKKMQEELLKKERRRNENVLKNALANLKSRAAIPKEQQEQYSKVHAESANCQPSPCVRKSTKSNCEEIPYAKVDGKFTAENLWKIFSKPQSRNLSSENCGKTQNLKNLQQEYQPIAGSQAQKDPAGVPGKNGAWSAWGNCGTNEKQRRDP